MGSELVEFEGLPAELSFDKPDLLPAAPTGLFRPVLVGHNKKR